MREWRNNYGIDVLQNDVDAAWELPDWLTPAATAPVQGFHRSMAAYAPTPLLRLDELAHRGGVSAVYVKNEAERFGLNAFKALGSSFAIGQEVCRRLGLDIARHGMADILDPRWCDQVAGLAFATATDGNHGRGVAWTAQLLGCRAFVYMPRGTEPERVEAIRALGATVTVTDVSYDETVALAAAEAAANGWVLVQDTSFAGYEDIPKAIIQGYSTIAAEVADELRAQGKVPTHIFLQAGVGSMAGGLAACYLQEFAAAEPKIVILEPKDVACCYLSARAGENVSVGGVQQTIMAGLNCGTPCPLIMPILQQRAEFFLACPDFVAAHGMRLAERPLGDDPHFVSGESGAIGLGTAALLLQRPELAEVRAAMGIDERSVLLVLNTEGAMAPSVWRRIVQEGEYPLP